MALLTIKDLSLGYHSQPVVEGLNFSVQPGDYICIIGENGSGKTTLMKTLLQLQKPLAGDILMGEQLKMNDIGYLPQQTQMQKDFPASVMEVVLSGCQGSNPWWRPFYTKEQKERARKNLERLGLSEYKAHSYSALSGGQQQRVLLARALCATQKILLLDEPGNGLDPEVTKDMYRWIARLNQQGLTILMISHDVEAAIRYASHILHIGDTVFFGTKQSYIDAKKENGGNTGWNA